MRAKLSDVTIEKMMAAVLAEAKANEKLQQVLAATLKKLREKNPQAADAVLRVMIEIMAASMSEDRREKFLNELIAFVRPSEVEVLQRCGRIRVAGKANRRPA